eukprot:scaffold1487_cov130-Skeletonema_marinoi.AAC.4
MDARIKPDVEVCVSDMEHRGNESIASKAWPGACGVILSSDAGAAELLLCHAAKVDALNQQAKSIILFLSSIKSNIN